MCFEPHFENFHKVWSRPDCPLPIYSILTADTVHECVTLIFDLLSLVTGHTWRVTWSTPPTSWKILRLSVLELWVLTCDIIHNAFATTAYARYYVVIHVRTHNSRTDRRRIFQLVGGVEHVTRHVCLQIAEISFSVITDIVVKELNAGVRNQNFHRKLTNSRFSACAVKIWLKSPCFQIAKIRSF